MTLRLLGSRSPATRRSSGRPCTRSAATPTKARPTSSRALARPGHSEAELIASDGAANDQFGASVAISGETALVGAPFNHDYQGAAYVFTRSGSSWSQQAELVASDGGAWDQFGESVALDGDTAVIGAPGHQVGSNDQQGAAYVFGGSGASWSQQAELTASDGAAYDEFGWSVAISAGTVLVGAPMHTADGNTYQGAAYLFGGSGSSSGPPGGTDGKRRSGQ